MFERTVSADDLARLKREREQADRDYNAALTELDQAILRPPEPPQLPPPFDDSQASLLNERWQIVPPEGPAFETGWRGRLRGFVWRFIGPYSCSGSSSSTPASSITSTASSRLDARLRHRSDRSPRS